MSRLLCAFVGVVITLFPKNLLAEFEIFAAKHPDNFRPKYWLIPYIQAGGLLMTLICLAGGRAYALVMKFIGAIGVIQFLSPEKYLQFGANMAYEQPDTYEWKKRVLPVIRIIGMICILLAVRALKQPADSE